MLSPSKRRNHASYVCKPAVRWGGAKGWTGQRESWNHSADDDWAPGRRQHLGWALKAEKEPARRAEDIIRWMRRSVCQGPVPRWGYRGRSGQIRGGPLGLRAMLLLLLLSHCSRVRLCATPQTAAHQAPPCLGFSRQEHWSGLPFPSPMQESEKREGSRSVVSDSSRPHGLQPTRLLRAWDFPGKRTGVGCIAFST